RSRKPSSVRKFSSTSSGRSSCVCVSCASPDASGAQPAGTAAAVIRTHKRLIRIISRIFRLLFSAFFLIISASFPSSPAWSQAEDVFYIFFQKLDEKKHSKGRFYNHGFWNASFVKVLSPAF